MSFLKLCLADGVAEVLCHSDSRLQEFLLRTEWQRFSVTQTTYSDTCILKLVVKPARVSPSIPHPPSHRPHTPHPRPASSPFPPVPESTTHRTAHHTGRIRDWKAPHAAACVPCVGYPRESEVAPPLSLSPPTPPEGGHPLKGIPLMSGRPAAIWLLRSKWGTRMLVTPLTLQLILAPVPVWTPELGSSDFQWITCDDLQARCSADVGLAWEIRERAPRRRMRKKLWVWVDTTTIPEKAKQRSRSL